jgi:transcriptional regulator with XRE-family HTH domain
MADRSVIGKRIREARLRVGLSQKQLGINAGIDEFSASPRVNQYEQGKHVPDLRTAERLAKVLQVPTPFLYARDEALASWILAHDIVDASTRRAVLRKIMKRVPRE